MNNYITVIVSYELGDVFTAERFTGDQLQIKQAVERIKRGGGRIASYKEIPNNIELYTKGA